MAAVLVSTLMSTAATLHDKWLPVISLYSLVDEGSGLYSFIRVNFEMGNFSYHICI